MPNQQPVTNITDPRWLRAVSHPIRIRLLAMLDEEPASPVILAAKLEQPLGTIAYHVRTLYDLGLLKLVSTRQRRGATEHYYKTISHPRVSEESWDELDAVSKQRLLTAQLTKAHDYATRSAAAGGFDRANARFSTTSLKLDEQGWTELANETKKWQDKADAIAQKAAARLEKKPESKVDAGLTVQLFEALPFSAAKPQESADGDSGAAPKTSKAAAKQPAKRAGKPAAATRKSAAGKSAAGTR